MNYLTTLVQMKKWYTKLETKYINIYIVEEDL